ncbi:octopamine receptor-like [Branchiostoma lanceolatum]|uniref:octopamine receptor-like n=1 Tax=Branchiostoma lanceolatum TaxID=7740 RepID=UPI003456D1C3
MKGVQNLFLVSLAFSDVTVGALVMPFKLANELMGYWYFGQTWCDIYLALDVFACTASIFNLCAISIDRYWAITKPIKYLSMRTRRRVGVMIATVWMSSALVCLPPLFGWKSGEDTAGDERASDDAPGCQLNSSPGYVVFSSVSSFYIPLGVLIFVYTSIIRAVRKRFKVRNKITAGCPGNSNSATADGPGPSKWKPQAVSDSDDSYALAWANKVSSDMSDTMCRQKKHLQVLEPLEPMKTPAFLPRGPCFDGKMFVLPGTSMAKPATEGTSVMVTDTSGSHDAVEGLPEVETVEQPMTKPQFPRSDTTHKFIMKEAPDTSRVKSHFFNNARRSKDQAVDSVAQSLRQRRRQVRMKLRAAQAKERKSLSIIFCVVSVFIVCWLPFFVCYMVVTLCATCWVSPTFFMFSEWMGYGNSALNPVIYALFNKDFRDGIKTLFRRNHSGML